MKFLKIFLAALLAVIAGGILKLLFWIAVLTGVAGASDSAVRVERGSVLTLDFSELIADAPSQDPLADIDFMNMTSTRRVSLYDALKAVDAAALDDRIEGIYIRPTGGGAESWAVLEELREAIGDFRRSGKFVVAYSDVYAQPDYYLASVADSVYLQPMGAVAWQGLSFSTMFYKGLIDKLGVEVEVFRPTVCRYKSAVEPYILDRMSEANRRQMQELADAMWADIAGQVAESRAMDVAELNRLTDELAACEAEDAVTAGLVDRLVYEDQMEDIIASLTGSDDWHSVSLGEYASQVGQGTVSYSAPRVAIVYAEGGIVDGSGNGRGEDIGGDALAARLAEVCDDDDVKAVVLRVNSPGGSALASDVIWREMERLREAKPVIVSMGQYAASGGYYISAPADVIVADRLTLTGSIGVFGLMLNPTEALRSKLGVTFDAVKTNRSADMGQPGRSMTQAERAFMMRSVDKVYGRFTQLVADGRNLTLERVLEIAEGRVWSGTAACEIGLADRCGGLKTAIALAADKAGLTEFRVTEEIDEPSGLAMLVSSIGARVAARRMNNEMGEYYGYFERMKQALSQRGVTAYSDVRLTLE